MQMLLLCFRILTFFFAYFCCEKTKSFHCQGSSREFVGFSTDSDESVISYMWKRAGEFFPKLRMLSLSDPSASRKVRVGLRPYSESLCNLMQLNYLYFIIFISKWKVIARKSYEFIVTVGWSFDFVLLWLLFILKN